MAEPTKAPRRAPGWRFLHLADYALNDSLAGVRLAKKLRFGWIDLNFQTTSDGTIVCTHWSQPLKHGWRDPLREIKPDTRVWQMTWAEVDRLRHRRSGRRIYQAKTILRYAAQLGIGVEFEVKPSPWFGSERTWAYLRRFADQHDVRMVVKAIHNLGDAGLYLKRAHDAGFTTIVLPRGTRRISTTWWPFVDYVRGPVHWVRPSSRSAANA